MPRARRFRAVQGARRRRPRPARAATVGELVPPRERGRYQGLIGAVFARGGDRRAARSAASSSTRSAGAGSSSSTCRSAALALVAIYLTMPREPRRRERSVDWLGAALLAAGSSALLLGLVWGGREFPWSSATCSARSPRRRPARWRFALSERRVPEPILPFAILRRPDRRGRASLSIGLLGMAMLGTIVVRAALRAGRARPLGDLGRASSSSPLHARARSARASLSG